MTVRLLDLTDILEFIASLFELCEQLFVRVEVPLDVAEVENEVRVLKENVERIQKRLYDLGPVHDVCADEHVELLLCKLIVYITLLINEVYFLIGILFHFAPINLR